MDEKKKNIQQNQKRFIRRKNKCKKRKKRYRKRKKLYLRKIGCVKEKEAVYKAKSFETCNKKKNC